MKKTLIAMAITCILMAGCRTSQKTTEKITTDSVAAIVHNSQSKLFETDSQAAECIMMFDSISVTINFDTAGKMSQKHYFIKGIGSRMKASHVKTAAITAADSTAKASAHSLLSDQEVNTDRSPIAIFWKAFALIMLAMVAVAVHRALRG